jgi:hypothetical protein
MSETSRPSIITVGMRKKSHFDKHKHDKLFSAALAASERSGRLGVGPYSPVANSEVVARPHCRRFNDAAYVPGVSRCR